MSDKRAIQIGAIVSWAVVFIGYYATMAPTTSFWDCGEFIASAVTMAVPHPPGSPLYIVVGRVFSLLPTDTLLIWLGLASPESDIGFRVNLMSPLTGSLAALFTYLTIVRLIKQLTGRFAEGKTWTTVLGAFVGATVFAFSYSNWFNAVEAEVYAWAIFFMMGGVWLILRWTDEAKTPHALRLVLLMAYIFGVAGGVHLLVLLLIPTVVIIAIFTYYDYRDGLVLLGALGALALAGYFAMHASNAWGLRALLESGGNSRLDVVQRTQAFGFDDPTVYFQIMLVFTLLSGIAAVVIPMFARSIEARKVWVSTLAIISASAAMKAASDSFFFFVDQKDSFPIGTWLAAATALALAFYLAQDKRGQVSIRKIFHVTLSLELLFVVGYSTYLILLVRSGLDPIIDENNPENWRNFFLFITRKQYGAEPQSLIVFVRRAAVGWQFWDMFIKYFVQQFPMSISRWPLVFRNATDLGQIVVRLPDVPLILGFFGIAMQYKGDARRFWAMLTLFLITGVGLFLYLNMPDPQPRERHYVFTGASSVFAIWIGMGATGLVRYVQQKWGEIAGYGGAAAMLVVPLFFVFGYPLWDHWSAEFKHRYTNWQSQNRSKDFVAFDYAYNILESCEPGGIIFTNGDNDTFPLWYLQEARNIRKDVRIVNLSLLNTSWYIKQLKEQEPKVAIGPSLDDDDYIENVLCGNTREALVRSNRVDVEGGRIRKWATKTVRATSGIDTVSVTLKNGRHFSGQVRAASGGNVSVRHEGEWVTIDTAQIADITRGYTGLEWQMSAPSDYGILRVQDVMVYNIVHYNEWKRPIYFAVTVSDGNKIGLTEHLRMEGMVFRLHLDKNDSQGARRGKSIEEMSPATRNQIDRWTNNLFNVYQMRHLQDSSIYKDDNMLKLVSNYRSAYLQLARLLASYGQNEEALKVLAECEQKIPFDRQTGIFASQIAYQAQDNEAALFYARRADNVTRREIEGPYGGRLHRDILNGGRRSAGIRHVGYAYERVGAYDRLADMMRFAVERAPGPSPEMGIGVTDVVSLNFELARALRLSGKTQEARTRLTSLQSAYPQYDEIRRELELLGPAVPDTSGQ